MTRVSQPILLATVAAGTLDIAGACLSSWIVYGRSPATLLRGVAAGPFGDVMRDGGPFAAMAGLAVHYGIMAVIATVFVLAVRAMPALVRHPVPIGLAYGALTYLVMYWIVLPMRWPTVFPVTRPMDVTVALAFQLLLVGVPIALVAARFQHEAEPRGIEAQLE